MRCPGCGGMTRNYRTWVHENSKTHRLGKTIREMFVSGQPPGAIAEALGLRFAQLRVVMLRLGITTWRGKKKNPDRRGPRSAVPQVLESLAVELEARGMLVEAAMTGYRGHTSRIYLNGRRCAISWPSEKPKHFEDEAPIVSVRRPSRQDWEFLIVVTSYGRLVLNKSECPVASTNVAIASGQRRGFVTQNWKSKLEAWVKVKPVSYSRPRGKVGAVTPEDSRGAAPVVVVKKHEEDDARDAQRAVEETVTFGGTVVVPSAEDLDRVAEEQESKESTRVPGDSHG